MSHFLLCNILLIFSATDPTAEGTEESAGAGDDDGGTHSFLCDVRAVLCFCGQILFFIH